MKKIILLLFIGCTFSSHGQGFNDDKTAFSNFLKRMYNSSPFEGVKLVEDYDNEYIISVLSLEKGTKSFSILSRVAQVKAQRQVSTFFNGSTVTAEFIIKTTEEKADSSEVKTTVETIDKKQVALKIPKGTKPGTTFNLTGLGIPNIRTGKKGNLHVTVEGKIPNITDDKILNKIREIQNELNL